MAQKRPDWKRTPEKEARAREMRAAGASWRAIGIELDVRASTVRCWIDVEYAEIRSEQSKGGHGRKRSATPPSPITQDASLVVSLPQFGSCSSVGGAPVEVSLSRGVGFIVPASPAAALSNAVTILSVRFGQCRWPVEGAGLDAIFCGDRVRDASCPYCATHALRAFRPPETKRRRRLKQKRLPA